MSSKELIKLLEGAGWKFKRVEGSHHQFKHPNHRLLITVPHPEKDIKAGTLNRILKIAGLK